jgi:hypothetical protein
MEGTPKSLTGFLGLDSRSPIEIIADRIRESRSGYRVVDILTSIPRRFFTDDRHYLYYKTYVVPKLKLVGRRYIQRYPRRGRYAYRHSFRLRVGLSNSYIVLNVIRNVRLLEREGGEYVEVGGMSWRNYTYVLGLNSDGRLFVNRVGFEATTLPELRLIDFGYVDVFETEDGSIVNALGFDRSVDSFEEVTITHGGNYRVQGEVIMAVNQPWTGGVASIEDFYSYVLNSMGSQLLGYARYLALDRVAVELINMGFSVRLARRHASDVIRIVDAYSRGADEDRVAAAVAAELCRLIRGSDPVKDPNSLGFKCEVGDRVLGSYTVHVCTTGIPFMEQHGDIEVAVSTPEGPRIVEVLSNELLQQLRRMTRETFRIMLGNHLVEVENAYSSGIAYTPTVQPLVLPPRTIAVEGVSYYVDQSSVVRITHREHGSIAIRFSRPFMIGFTTTTVNENYPGEVNRLTVRQLIERHRFKVSKIVGGAVRRCVPLVD